METAAGIMLLALSKRVAGESEYQQNHLYCATTPNPKTSHCVMIRSQELLFWPSNEFPYSLFFLAPFSPPKR